MILYNRSLFKLISKHVYMFYLCVGICTRVHCPQSEKKSSDFSSFSYMQL